ncbi:Pantoate-beta-alanine ligase [Mariniblastus fucicola]|uniref:Pantothenate synthetase n=2 Tax=Mariniblastus fucicola TaxID=980251 RepID=A0A5B9PIX0_9BACT|nr:Pantoate-beta-alanine ligase [Mariniblastus fucicola]
MGALHEGHLSLARASVAESDVTVVTIFVNPTQFAPGEDLDKYPRRLEEDVKLLGEVGVDHVFCPEAETMYAPGSSTSVSPPKISRKLEGEFRPTHFGGVATIVLKLFNIVAPDVAYFGQKDYQQVVVVKQMVRDLNVPVEVRTCPIVRDNDGLALSSRNIYLSPEEREVALTINRTLSHVRQQILDGQRDGFEVLTEMRQMLIDGGVTSIDYAAVVNPDTLESADPIQLPVALLIAVYVGKTRLIDNCLVTA